VHIGIASPLSVEELRPWLSLGEDQCLPTGPGGATMTTLLRGILGEGYRVSAVTLDPRVRKPVVLRGDRLDLFIGPFRPRHAARDYFRAERRFVEETLAQARPEVVGAHWTYEFGLGALDSGIPTLVSVHDAPLKSLRYTSPRVWPAFAVRALMNVHTLVKAPALLAVSPYIGEVVGRWHRGPVPVVPNAFDEMAFQGLPRQPDLDRPQVLAVNEGFGRRKNVQNLLRAFPIVRAAVPAARLVLVGTGYEEHGPAFAWASKHDLLDGVEFVGHVPRSHVDELMESSEVLAHPSREESFGFVLVEAMAKRTPVVAGQRSGAVPWVLAEGRAGILTDVVSPRAIGDSIAQLLSDAQQWSALSESAHDLALNRFAGARVVRDYVAELRAVIENDH
jgi:glycosyltransferase involved in cell wall biosynthesis